MILKELFLSFDFDRVLAEYMKIYANQKESAINLKQAYDEIRLIEIEFEDKPKKIEVYIEHEKDYEYIAVANCDDQKRQVLAGRQIAVIPELKINAEEIAAHCLRELTYYGFNEAVEKVLFEGNLPSYPDELNNRYWKEYHEKSMRWFSLSFKEILHRKAKQNHSKRKRYYRRKKRLRQLRRYAKIEELQKYLTINRINFDLWGILTWCKSFSVVTDRSYASAPEDAEQYLYKLYSKYGSTIKNNEEIAFTIIILTGGSKVTTDYPKLYDVLKKTFKYPTVLVGDSNEEQITVKIISVKTYPLKSKTKK